LPVAVAAWILTTAPWWAGPFDTTGGVRWIVFAYAMCGAMAPIPPADLADQAKAMSAFIECHRSRSRPCLR